MTRVVHLIDRETSADLVGQLSLLACPEDEIISLGPAPPGCDDLSVCPVRRGTGWRLWPHRRVGPLAGKVAHAWSVSAFRIAAPSVGKAGGGMVLSLSSAWPGGHSPFVRRILRRRSGVITVPTRWARDHLLAAGAGVGHVAVLPPPAEIVSDQPARRARTRAGLGLREDDRLLVVPAGLQRLGGGKQACWVFAILRKFLERVRLLLPGGGPAEAHVKRFAAGTGHGEDILFAPELGMEDALASADAAVFLQERGAGLWALASAMAAGLPIVASANAELAQCAGESGLLVQPGDYRQAAQAAWKLLDSPEFARRLGAAAKERASVLFDPNRSRRCLEEIDAAAEARRLDESMRGPI